MSNDRRRMPLSERRLLTVEHACDYADHSRTRIFDLIQKNMIHTVKVGRRRLIDRASLDDYIAGLSA